MAGLLSDVLPFLYSQGDRAKRYIGGLLGDPVGTAQQYIGNLNDQAGVGLGLLGASGAPSEPVNPARAQLIANMAQAMPIAGITAWHGSPHVFNAFDSSKIGTGEGAQAYGHGLYLAGKPETAKQYQEALKNKDFFQKMTEWGYQRGREMGLRPYVDDMAHSISRGGDALPFEKFQEVQRSVFRKEVPDSARPLWDEMVQKSNPGALYKVDLPDSAVARMLDWDTELAKQPQAVHDALQQLPAFARDSATGADLYKSLARTSVGPKYNEAATMLRQNGVPGIRYLDGGSRGNGAGTSNFVVFPGQESLLKILERNGVPLR